MNDSASPQSSSTPNPLSRLPRLEDRETGGVRDIHRGLRSLVLFFILGILLFFALRNAPLIQIWDTLLQLHGWQLLLLLGINSLVIIFMTLRWWLIVHAENPRLPFFPLIGYRLSVFALSYFTPGPQVGGEPLQIILLRRNHRVSFARAASAVVIDKLLEFLGNFVFIGVGLLAVIRLGILPERQTLSWIGWSVLVGLMSWPPVHLFLLYSGRKPLTALVKVALARYKQRKWFRLLVASEYLAASFTRRYPWALSVSLVASLLSWTGMGLEYWLMLQFLQIHLDLWQALAGLTLALLAFLMPLPGGLGALEASQVLALGTFGYGPASAISLALLMRARDLLNGGIGLLISGRNLKQGY